MRVESHQHSNRFSTFTTYILCPLIKKDVLSKSTLNRFLHAEICSLYTHYKQVILCCRVLTFHVRLRSEYMQTLEYLMRLHEGGTDPLPTRNLKDTISVFSAIRTKKVRQSCVWEVEVCFRMVTYEVESKIFRTGAANYTKVVVARSTVRWKDYHV
jgi:hypothetical protein